MAQELELKFVLRPRHLKRVADMSWLKRFQVTTLSKHKLYTIYFDTPDLALKANDCSLRIRRDGKKWLQTIKSGSQIRAGVHQHDEWEIPLIDAHPDLSNIPDPKIRKLFRSPDLQTMLQPVFVTRFTRLIQLLKLTRGSLVELCLDHGKIIAGDQTESINEIEIELKSGNPLELLNFGKVFIEKAPCALRMETLNKAERGYRLYSSYIPIPYKASNISFKSDIPLHPALKMIVQNCLKQLNANEKGFLSVRDDIEYLHQMRVALRRLRAAFHIYQQISPDTEWLQLSKTLKWLTKQLNPARDWDILVTETLPQAGAGLPHSTRHLIEKQCQSYRKREHRHARASVGSLRYTILLIDLCSWLYQIDEADASIKSSQSYPDTMRQNTKATVASLINASHQKIMEYGKSIATLDTESLHTLRIHIKELRYLIEFFHSLFPQNSCKQHIDALSGLQNALGAINDYHVAQHLFDEIQIRKKTHKQSKAIGIIREWAAQRIQMKRTALTAAWQYYAKSRPFWKSGDAVV